MARLSDKDRLKALRETGLLDGPMVPALDRYVRMLAQAIDAPVGLISLVDDERQFFVSQTGLPPEWASARQTGLLHSFCKHVVEDESELVVEDARTNQRLQNNLAIADLSVIAYAGVPIGTPAGHILGSFCAIDTRPRAWNEKELSLLREIGAAVNNEIELRRNLTVLEEAEHRLAAEARSLEDHSREIEHDIRTPLSVLSSCIGLISEHEAIAMFPELARVVALMQRNVGHAASIASSEVASSDARVSDIADIVRSICQGLEIDASSRLEIRNELPPGFVLAVAPEMIHRAIENMLTNALRFSAKRVRIRVRREDALTVIAVEDDGPGLPSHASDRVWERGARFHTESGQSRSGLGLYIVKQIAEELNGFVSADRSPDLGGARFRLYLRGAETQTLSAAGGTRETGDEDRQRAGHTQSV